MKGIDLEGLTPQRVQFDTTEVISAFNYSLSIEPEQGIFVITILPSMSAKRIQLPFAALEFAGFRKNIDDAHENWMRRNDETTDSATMNGDAT